MKEVIEYYRDFERAADADLDIVHGNSLAAKKQAEENAKKVRYRSPKLILAKDNPVK